MRTYYTKEGEELQLITPKKDAIIIDLTKDEAIKAGEEAWLEIENFLEKWNNADKESKGLGVVGGVMVLLGPLILIFDLLGASATFSQILSKLA